MKVQTYLFGEVDIDQERVLTFPNGLLAFETCQRFMLVHEEGASDAPVSYTLQSLDDPLLAFQIMDPVTLGFHYELALSDAETALLQSPDATDLAVMLMLFKKDDGNGKAEISPNLRAPLIINTRAKIGIQKVMEQLRSNIVLSNLVNPV